MKMCCRYYLDRDLLEDLGMVNDGELEIRPSMVAPAIIRGQSGFLRTRMNWGFPTDQTGKRIINARSESVLERPLFKGLYHSRCLLPASGYYEWRRSDKHKYNIRKPTNARFYIGGLYRAFNDRSEFVILTRKPVDEIATLHDRMPIVFEDKRMARDWLNGALALDTLFSLTPFSIEPMGAEQLTFL